MKNLVSFVQEHLEDDVTRLILDRAKWPEIDIELAAACIESRRKLRNKVQEWYANPELVFPVRLSAEQCSSTATGLYKSALAERIADKKPFKLADLTGGLGVDSWFFSKKAGKVLYNEMQKPLCEAAEHNFKALGIDNVIISNNIASTETIGAILEGFDPDIIYMDPARRGEGGRKVFLIEECTPDVLGLKESLFKHARHILLKLSPMADISMVCSRLGKTCREVHIVASGGECKELLVWMDREWAGEYSITATELPADYPASEPAIFAFNPDAEKEKSAEICGTMPSEDTFLFEPGKALMKSGCFNLIGRKLDMVKLGHSTHFYLTEDARKAEDLRKLGRVYRIINCVPLDKRSIKEAGRTYPRAEVTARNIPMDTDTLRKKLGVTSGDDAHIFGLKADTLGNLLIITV